MKRRLYVSAAARASVVILVVIVGSVVAGCSFDQFAQSSNLETRIDEYRTGCELDDDKLLSEYLQYDANEFYIPGFGDTPRPTPTPGPASGTDLQTQLMLTKVWEHGCQTGRQDVTGSETADWLALKDQLDVLATKVNQKLTPTPTTSP